MSNKMKPYDCEGNKIYIGDKVVLIRLTNHLLDNLPIEDKNAIIAQVGKIFELMDFDDYGFAELNFEFICMNTEVTFHSIWVDPNCLKKVKSKP